MANVYPFRPYRYSAEAGPLDKLVTQPYDKITPEMQRRYLDANPHNLVRIILGERFPADTDHDNVYTRAAKHFRDWIAQGIFQQDAEPGLYAYNQEFEVPDSGERAVRKGFIGLGAVEDYSEGTVHRHEQTLSTPREDRLNLLRHTRAHFGQIFMLYPDPAGEIDRMLDEAARGEPLATISDEYQAVHRLWKIADPATVTRIQDAMRDKKLIIADGHHRYETALAFRNENPGLEDARKVMMTFVNLRSPGLKILPTHRVVHGLRAFDERRFIEQASELFEVIRLADAGDVRKVWRETQPDLIRIGVVLPGGAYLLQKGRLPGMLDVRLLHQAVLESLLSIGEADIREESHLRYVRGLEGAVEQVRRGEAQAAFLLEPPKIEEVAQIAWSGGVMPQKSTDFYPKLLSGLTIYKL